MSFEKFFYEVPNTNIFVSLTEKEAATGIYGVDNTKKYVKIVDGNYAEWEEE